MVGTLVFIVLNLIPVYAAPQLCPKWWFYDVNEEKCRPCGVCNFGGDSSVQHPSCQEPVGCIGPTQFIYCNVGIPRDYSCDQKSLNNVNFLGVSCSGTCKGKQIDTICTFDFIKRKAAWDREHDLVTFCDLTLPDIQPQPGNNHENPSENTTTPPEIFIRPEHHTTHTDIVAIGLVSLVCVIITGGALFMIFKLWPGCPATPQCNCDCSQAKHALRFIFRTTESMTDETVSGQELNLSAVYGNSSSHLNDNSSATMKTSICATNSASGLQSEDDVTSLVVGASQQAGVEPVTAIVHSSPDSLSIEETVVKSAVTSGPHTLVKTRLEEERHPAARQSSTCSQDNHNSWRQGRSQREPQQNEEECTDSSGLGTGSCSHEPSSLTFQKVPDQRPRYREPEQQGYESVLSSLCNSSGMGTLSSQGTLSAQMPPEMEPLLYLHPDNS